MKLGGAHAPQCSPRSYAYVCVGNWLLHYHRGHVVRRSVRSAPLAYYIMTSLNGRKLQSDQAHREYPETTPGKKNIRVFEQPQTEQLTKRVE